MVHFGSGVHVRHLTSSNVSTASLWSPCLSDMPSKAKENSDETTYNAGNSPLAGESVEAAPVGHICHTTLEECKKRKERIINFDEVSEWLKKINLSRNNVHQTTDNPKETGTISASSDLKVVKRAGIHFDAISKMIKMKRKARKGNERAKESSTAQLKKRAKRIERLLYVLD